MWSSSWSSVKTDQDADEVEEEETEYRSCFWWLLSAVPRAEGTRGGTSPPFVCSMNGEDRALLAEDMDGEVWASRSSHSSLQ